MSNPQAGNSSKDPSSGSEMRVLKLRGSSESLGRFLRMYEEGKIEGLSSVEVLSAKPAIPDEWLADLARELSPDKVPAQLSVDLQDIKRGLDEVLQKSPDPATFQGEFFAWLIDPTYRELEGGSLGSDALLSSQRSTKRSGSEGGVSAPQSADSDLQTRLFELVEDLIKKMEGIGILRSD